MDFNIKVVFVEACARDHISGKCLVMIRLRINAHQPSHSHKASLWRADGPLAQSDIQEGLVVCLVCCWYMCLDSLCRGNTVEGDYIA